MPSSLTALLLAAHRPAPTTTRRASAESLAGDVHVDHALMFEARAPRVLTALESLGDGRTRVQPSLVAFEGPGVLAAGRDASTLGGRIERWRRAGAQCSVVGAGVGDVLYRDGCAAPGRMVLCAGRALSPCGALGTLACGTSELGAAVALATGTAAFTATRLVGVWIAAGEAPRWVGGMEVALEVLRRIPSGTRSGTVVEFTGPGVAALPMSERHAIASTLALGRAFALFPSDECTRQALRELGREADWRRLEADQNAAYEDRLEIELSLLEPACAPRDGLENGRRVREGAGLAVTRVLIGPLATVADLAACARVLRASARVRDGVQLIVLPGSRAMIEAATQAGVIASIVEDGGRVLDAGAFPTWSGEGNGLCFGVRAEDVIDDRGRWFVAGPWMCALAAATGELSGAPEWELPAAALPESPPPAHSAGAAWLPALGAGENPEVPVRSPAWALGRPLTGAPRGTVLARLGDRVSADELLPRGARIEALESDVAQLAEVALTPRVVDFAAGARLRGGGIVAAGESLGIGEPRPAAALALAQLGVFAVLARSIEPALRDALCEAGVLPLSFTSAGDYDALRSGDELELPGLPEALEPDRALTARNLTQGTQYRVGHHLDARTVEIARSGGLLAHARRALNREREEVE